MKGPLKHIASSVYSRFKWIFIIIIAISILTSFIANDVPIFCASDQGYSLPILNKQKYQSLLLGGNNGQVCHSSISPIIPYTAGTINTKDRLLPPGSGRHILGTDSLGRDIFAGMLYGLRSALLLAFISMLIAGLGGIIIGSMAGYFGNKTVLISRLELVAQIMLTSIWIFIGFGLLKYFFGVNLFSILIFLFILIGLSLLIHKILVGHNRHDIHLPIDDIIMRSIEIIKSIPGLFILLALLGYIQQSNIYFIALLIGLLSIPNISRLVRGEILNIKSSDFVISSIILNYNHRKILFQQILPNIIGPLGVALSFGAAGAILIESSLSFLGIGLGLEEVTWGSILTESRKYHTAWWLAVVPGLGIFSLILFFNRIGRYISTLYRSESTGL